VPTQDNGCDCGVFVCRYAYSLYIMRDQVFDLAGIKNNFRKMITDGPAFNFNNKDIARMREDMRSLFKSLNKLYVETREVE
jgi:Ulp1 family protease